MKKLVIAALLVMAVSFGTAQSVGNATVTPDHPLYDTKLSLEKQIEGLAPNETAEARAKLESAETRLAETQTLVDENKTELANMTANNYSEQMKELQDFGQQISKLAQQRKVNQLIANATMFHTEVLSRVHERVPEQAKAGIEKALNRSVTGYQRAVQSLNETGGVPSGLPGGNQVKSMAPESVQDRMGDRSTRSDTSGGGQTGSGQDAGAGNIP